MKEMKPRWFMIPGTPIPLQRPRFHQRGRPYDVQKLLKKEWMYHIDMQNQDQPMMHGPIGLLALFTFPVARMNMTRFDHWNNKPHDFRPDLDNCLKFLNDCCQGILYRDDCEIASTWCEKNYGLEPGTNFVIYPITDKILPYELRSQPLTFKEIVHAKFRVAEMAFTEAFLP